MGTLLERLKATLKSQEESERRREERIRNCDMEFSDGFVSAYANGLSQSLTRTQIQILENGGLWEFECLCDLEGNKVDAKLCQTKFGSAYRVEKVDGTVEWINPYVKEKTLAKKGYKLGKELKPAWAKLGGSGKGISGMMNVYVQIFPVRKNKLEEDRTLDKAV